MQASYKGPPKTLRHDPPLGGVPFAGSCPEEVGKASPTLRQAGGQDKRQAGGSPPDEHTRVDWQHADPLPASTRLIAGSAQMGVPASIGRVGPCAGYT